MSEFTETELGSESGCTYRGVKAIGAWPDETRATVYHRGGRVEEVVLR